MKDRWTGGLEGRVTGREGRWEEGTVCGERGGGKKGEKRRGKGGGDNINYLVKLINENKLDGFFLPLLNQIVFFYLYNRVITLAPWCFL